MIFLTFSSKEEDKKLPRQNESSESHGLEVRTILPTDVIGTWVGNKAEGIAETQDSSKVTVSNNNILRRLAEVERDEELMGMPIQSRGARSRTLSHTEVLQQWDYNRIEHDSTSLKARKVFEREQANLQVIYGQLRAASGYGVHIPKNSLECGCMYLLNTGMPASNWFQEASREQLAKYSQIARFLYSLAHAICLEVDFNLEEIQLRPRDGSSPYL